MKKTILLLLSITILTVGCKKDSPEITYDLKVTNSFNTDLEVYLTDGTDTDTFESRGVIEAIGEITIEGLAYDTDYVLRSVQIGNDENNFVTQHSFKHTDTAERELTITIEF